MARFLCDRGARRGRPGGAMQAAIRLVALSTAIIAGTWVSTASAQQPGLRTHCFGPPQDDPVDLFAAMQNDRLETRVIVRDPFHARLLMTNPSLVPITVRLPEAFAARPVLAQFGQNNPFGGQPANRPTTQAVGASNGAMPFGQQLGRGAGNGAGNGNFFNNGIFNIPPEKVCTVDLTCLCLEQGKPNPRTAIDYELVPLSEVNGDARLAHVLALHARGEVDRDVAQAAAWNVASGLDWEQLARLSQMIALNAERPVFSPQQLREARALLTRAAERAASFEAAQRAAVRSAPPQAAVPITAARESGASKLLSTKDAAAVKRKAVAPR